MRSSFVDFDMTSAVMKMEFYLDAWFERYIMFLLETVDKLKPNYM
jgi:hypothetical protein